MAQTLHITTSQTDTTPACGNTEDPYDRQHVCADYVIFRAYTEDSSEFIACPRCAELLPMAELVETDL